MSSETAPTEAGDPGEADGLAPHTAGQHGAGFHDIFDEAATYEDAEQPGTATAAADQPYLLKARQREDYADGGPRAHHRAKVTSPLKLSGATWKYSLKRAVAEFSKDQGTDLAAALTYYAVLSIFPALIAGVSLLSLIGEAQRTQEFFLDMFAELVDEEFMGTIESMVAVVTEAPGAGLGLAVGILAALWTASNFVNAFSRAMNRIFEVPEGRSAVQLRPLLYAVTAALILLIAASAVMLVLSGPLAEAVGSTIGMGETAVTVWNYATVPGLLLVAVICIALLYYCTPNIRQPGATWMSAGALVAIIVMVLATAGLGFYIGNFANYQATYGALAGVIIFLLWIYIMNVVLLFGAELDAELERGRQLQAGIEAERTIMLPPRQIKAAEKKSAKYEELVAHGRALRMSQGKTSRPDDVWRR